VISKVYFLFVFNFYLYSEDELPNKVLPSKQTGYAGHTVKFTCISEIQVQWRFNRDIFYNKIIKSETGTSKHKMIIFGLQLYNEGTHTCYGRDSNGYLFKSSGELKVLKGISV